MRRAASLLVIAAIASAGPAASADLGVYGATFRVVEEDLLAVIAARLEKAQREGKMDTLNKAFTARVKAKLNRPPPVVGISKTSRPRTWLVDPSITVPQDFADQKGRVFARRGERINPLDRLPNYNRVLVFIDGDDPAQVAFAVKRAKRTDKEKVYIVLTSGAPIELMRREKVEMFFDQGGTLTSHFGVTQVPAVVEREGRALRVSELRP